MDKILKLIEMGIIQGSQVEEIKKVSQVFPLKITDYLIELIKKTNFNQSLINQFIPHKKELTDLTQEMEDPIGDLKNMPVRGIVHRYPDRILLMPHCDCVVHCRFCFRKFELVRRLDNLTENELLNAVDYIKHNKNIWEVIFTGGEPLLMSRKILKELLSLINQIGHVKIIRIHTRLPIIEPSRLTMDYLSVLQTEKKPIFVVIHCNHPVEISSEAISCFKIFNQLEIPLFSQTVLLKAINDDPHTLCVLFRELLFNKVKPYYLHHCDMTKGINHFRTTIEKGMEIAKNIRKQLSGLCQPTYVLDIPKGYGKVPIGYDYIKSETNAYYMIEEPSSQSQHQYNKY